MSTARSFHDGDAQAAVDEFFNKDAPNWDAIYQRHDVFSVIHQQRQRIALEWVHKLRLSPATRVLEVGCGAGLVSIELARRGYEVCAVDSTSAMVELTRRNAKGAGVRLSAMQADAHHLEGHADRKYGLVLALGVIPWLHTPELAVAEMSRVLVDGGHLIVNADNRARLNHLVDPLLTPALGPVRGAAKALLKGGRSSPQAAPANLLHWPAQFDALLARHNLHKMTAQTFGFGPFSLMGRRVVSESRAVRLHLRLQALSDRGVPGLRSTGAQYIVHAYKAP